jgi:hypothetical protein
MMRCQRLGEAQQQAYGSVAAKVLAFFVWQPYTYAASLTVVLFVQRSRRDDYIVGSMSTRASVQHIHGELECEPGGSTKKLC